MDSNSYYIIAGEIFLILVLYVDDLIVAREDSLIQDSKVDLAREFDMKDM